MNSPPLPGCVSCTRQLVGVSIAQAATSIQRLWRAQRRLGLNVIQLGTRVGDCPLYLGREVKISEKCL